MKTLHVAVAIYAISLGSIFLGAHMAKADEMPKELSLKTDAGDVVLTTKPCKVENNHGFEYEAYATEGDIVHNGCWFRDHHIVNILFYDEPIKLVATFKDYLFKAREK